jgi:hypothetical protein
MKYFLDTEFLEGPQKEKFPISLFRKQTPNTIDLISIGIVAEDGREYYAISKDFNLKEAWNRWQYNENFISAKNQQGKEYWIRENVLKPIWRDLFFQADDCSGLSNKQTEAFYQGVLSGEYDQYFTFKSMKALIDKFGKTNKQIAEEILKFTVLTNNLDSINPITSNDCDTPEFYAYYADYDWVVFCWLFGKMMDLPDGFPMYCRDLKQIFDQKADWLRIPTSRQHMDLKAHTHYPKQENEHSAIDDARWNKKLYEFLKTI